MEILASLALSDGDRLQNYIRNELIATKRNIFMNRGAMPSFNATWEENKSGQELKLEYLDGFENGSI